MRDREFKELSTVLYYADQMKFQIPPVSKFYPDICEEDGYRIQVHLIRRFQDNGVRVIGKKVGGVQYVETGLRGLGPHYGYLLEEKVFCDGVRLEAGKYMNPGLEAEIVVVLKKDLDEGTVTSERVLEAIGWLCAGWEIVESRQIRDGKQLPDSLSDNASFGGCIHSMNLVPVSQIRDKTFSVEIIKNGNMDPCLTGSVTLEKLTESVAWLADQLIRRKEGIRAGEWILTGAMTSPLRMVGVGDSYIARFSELGTVTVHFE